MKTLKTKTKAVASTSEIVYVPLEHIVKHPDIPYRELDKDWAGELAEDIATNGLDVPLITWGGGETQQDAKVGDATFPARFLVAGLHRKSALVKFRKDNSAAFDKMFPNGVPVRHYLGTMQDTLYRSLRENVQRKHMAPEEIFPYLEKLQKEFKQTQRDIAKHVGKTEGWVSQMIAVNEELPEDIKKDVVEGNIDVGAARKLAADVRKAKKSGTPMTEEEIKTKASAAKEKTSKKKASGKKRAEKRHSAKQVYDLVQRLEKTSKMSSGRWRLMLIECLGYLAQETDKLPDELSNEMERARIEAEKAKELAKVEAKAKKLKDKQSTKPLMKKLKKKAKSAPAAEAAS